MQTISRFCNAKDGLRLHIRDWPSDAAGEPVVCLPGLARTAADFDALAAALCAGRRVVALDYRGRGLSDWDVDWRNYTLAVEHDDILTALTAAQISRAIFVGTSRGGMHAMILAASRAGIVRAAVLNDIGPTLEVEGLERIRGYVGKLPAPASWAEATALAKRLMGEQFPALDDAAFEAYARLTFEEIAGRFTARYDPQLTRTLEGLDLSAPQPDLWPQFDALKAVPLLVLRGETSDLFSRRTLAEMARRHPDMESHVVSGQGHAPLLLDAPTIARIDAFVRRVG